MWITKKEIAKHREISRGVRDDKINPFIDESQFLDVRPLLGDRLYLVLDSESKEGPQSNRFTELMEGGNYEYNGNTYFNPGLEKVLSIFSYARYILLGSFTDTAFGFVQKSDQDSAPVGDAQKRNIHKMEQQSAAIYFSQVALFINRNIDTYPEFKRDGVCKTNTSGRFRISKIS